MKITRHMIDDFMVVEIAGVVDISATGPLCDALVDSVNDGWTRLVVDLSGVSHFTRAGVRGLVVAARLLNGGRGELRIAGAGAATEEMLRGLGHSYLVRCDPTVEHAVLAMSASAVPAKPIVRAA